MPASYETHRKQLELILQAWGMAEATAVSTAEIMSWADLHGIDTHGISMVPRLRRAPARRQDRHARQPDSRRGNAGLGAGRRRRRPGPCQRAARDGAGDREGQGHRHRRRGGAQLGAFRRLRLLRADGGRGRADRHGHDIGAAASRSRRPSAPRPGSAPTRSPSPRPAAAASRSCSTWRPRPWPPARSATRPTRTCRRPPGWLVTAEGTPEHRSAARSSKGGFMTPLGGTPEGSSHKGYGLGGMVNILSSALSGRHHGHRPDAHQEAGTHGHRPFHAGDGSRLVPRRRRFPRRRRGLLRHAARHQARRSGEARARRRRIPNAAHAGSAPGNRHPGRSGLCWPRSARSRSPPARSGSWTALPLG